MANNNHTSIKENIIDGTIMACVFSLGVILIASIILMILYPCFMLSNFDHPFFKGNCKFALGAILSITTFVSTLISAHYVFEYFFPCEKYIPIFVLSVINITTFVISVVIYFESLNLIKIAEGVLQNG